MSSDELEKLVSILKSVIKKLVRNTNLAYFDSELELSSWQMLSFEMFQLRQQLIFVCTHLVYF